jgi:phage terminase large subunit-like protein
MNIIKINRSKSNHSKRQRDPFDKTFGQYIVPDLEAEGIQVMEVFQSFSNLGQQTKEFGDMVKKQEAELFGNPILKLHISNTVLHINSDGLAKPDKGASGHRIGSVSAVLNAMVARFVSTKEGVMDSFNFI